MKKKLMIIVCALFFIIALSSNLYAVTYTGCTVVSVGQNANGTYITYNDGTKDRTRYVTAANANRILAMALTAMASSFTVDIITAGTEISYFTLNNS